MPIVTPSEQVLILEEALAIEHARRVKAEATLRQIAQAERESAGRLRALAAQHFNEE